MTHVSTPNAGAFPRGKGSRKLGSMVGAVVITLAAGAAIATGIAVTQSDEGATVQSGVESTFNEGFRAQSSQTQEPSRQQLMEDLVRKGYIPAAALTNNRSAESPGQPR